MPSSAERPSRMDERTRAMSDLLAYCLANDEPPTRGDVERKCGRQLFYELRIKGYFYFFSDGHGQDLSIPALRGLAILPESETRWIIHVGDRLLDGMRQACDAGKTWCGMQELLPWCKGLPEEDACRAINFLRQESTIWSSWSGVGRTVRVQFSQDVLEHPGLESKIAEIRRQLEAEQAAATSIVPPAMSLERTDSTLVPASSPPRVFISYSHDTPEHARRVFDLANDLRAEGVDAWIDQYEIAPAQGWPRWMQEQIEQADFILLVCTPVYRRRFEGKESPGQGKGVTWEGLLAQQVLYEAQTRNERLIPVLFDEEDEEAALPMILRPYMRYQFPRDYEGLYRRLTGQPAVIAPPVGAVRAMPPNVSSAVTGATSATPSGASGDRVTIGPLPIRSTGLPDAPVLESATLDRATEHNREAALGKLLTELFDGNGPGLLQWLRLHLGKAIHDELPADSSLSQLTFEATLAIQRHGRADRALFESLRDVRPGLDARIREVARLWGSEMANVTEASPSLPATQSVTSATTPAARPANDRQGSAPARAKRRPQLMWLVVAGMLSLGFGFALMSLMVESDPSEGASSATHRPHAAPSDDAVTEPPAPPIVVDAAPIDVPAPPDAASAPDVAPSPVVVPPQVADKPAKEGEDEGGRTKPRPQAKCPQDQDCSESVPPKLSVNARRPKSNPQKVPSCDRQTNAAVCKWNGLIWQREPEIRPTWNDAKEYCRALVLDGWDDWFLPDKHVAGTLASQVPNTEGCYALDGIPGKCLAGPETPSDFWTRSTDCSEKRFKRPCAYSFVLPKFAVVDQSADDRRWVRCARKSVSNQ